MDWSEGLELVEKEKYMLDMVVFAEDYTFYLVRAHNKPYWCLYNEGEIWIFESFKEALKKAVELWYTMCLYKGKPVKVEIYKHKILVHLDNGETHRYDAVD